ncbi:MAG: hypothetical protein WBW33_03700 [Bryobacteraceae bacterium]
MKKDHSSTQHDHCRARSYRFRLGFSEGGSTRAGRRGDVATDWYDTKGFLNGKANVTVFGMK